jgi:hypothetical protein
VTHPSSSSSTIGGLLQELRDETTTLLRQEVALAKAELTEKAKGLTGHAVQMLIGGAIAYAGLIVLLFGFADLIAVALSRAGASPDLAAWLGPALVGLVIALVGYFMLSRARKAMAADTLVPERTLDSLRQNKTWAQSKIRQSHEQQPAL